MHIACDRPCRNVSGPLNFDDSIPTKRLDQTGRPHDSVRQLEPGVTSIANGTVAAAAVARVHSPETLDVQ